MQLPCGTPFFLTELIGRRTFGYDDQYSFAILPFSYRNIFQYQIIKIEYLQ